MLGMATSTEKPRLFARKVTFVRHSGKVWLTIELEDGRAVNVPISLYPSLAKATPRERNRWRKIGKGDGFHWPGLDLDISVDGIVAALPERKYVRRSAA